MADINKTTPMEDLTIGGNIYEAGNAKHFKTGDWRSSRPVWIEKNVNNVVYVFLFAQKMQFLFVKIL